jgi:hypothetical protein
MTDWFRYTVIAFGILFFVAHLALMVYSLPFARDRDTQFEYFGKIVPGLAGIGIACAAFVESSLLSILLVVVSGFVMILGRVIYELIVFRGSSDS